MWEEDIVYEQRKTDAGHAEAALTCYFRTRGLTQSFHPDAALVLDSAGSDCAVRHAHSRPASCDAALDPSRRRRRLMLCLYLSQAGASIVLIAVKSGRCDVCRLGYVRCVVVEENAKVNKLELN